MSSYLQYTCCYLGQQLVFKQAEEIFLKLSGVSVTDKQIERICHHYGEKLEADYQSGSLTEQAPVIESDSMEAVYIMMDGGMILSREKKHPWKEMKLARIFNKNDHIENINKDKNLITKSLYVSHLGTHDAFFKKLGFFTEHLHHWKKKVFIADGAAWIWKWVDDWYEESVQILDYYHAKEHLCQFALLYFIDREERDIWIKKKEQQLVNDEISTVIKQLEELLKLLTKERVKDELMRLIGYYRNNEKRMKYRTFRENGYLIGSGAMESAIRNVTQYRLKRSGQRWTIDGAQQVCNLRTVFLSGMEECVRKKIAA